MLSEVRIIVAHSDHDSGADRQRIPRACFLDVGTGYGRRGEGFIDCWKNSARHRCFGFPSPVPVLVIHACAVSVLDVRES